MPTRVFAPLLTLSTPRRWVNTLVAWAELIDLFCSNVFPHEANSYSFPQSVFISFSPHILAHTLFCHPYFRPLFRLLRRWMRMPPSGAVSSVVPARARAAERARVVPVRRVRREVRDRRAVARSLERAREARSQGNRALFVSLCNTSAVINTVWHVWPSSHYDSRKSAHNEMCR